MLHILLCHLQLHKDSQLVIYILINFWDAVHQRTQSNLAPDAFQSHCDAIQHVGMCYCCALGPCNLHA